MAIQILLGLGIDTNVSLATLNWAGASVSSTNHCAVSSVSLSGNTLSFTRLDDRIPMGWDVPDGTITNDCRLAFSLIPSMANAFRYSLTITNLPIGLYNISIDGTQVATNVSGITLSNGWNMFNLTVGPIWRQRVEVLGRVRDLNGADRVTLLDHGAGSQGTTGGPDLVNYNSNAQAFWDQGTNRGDILIGKLSTWETSLNNYDSLARAASLQTSHTFSVTFLAPPATSQRSGNMKISGGVILR